MHTFDSSRMPSAVDEGCFRRVRGPKDRPNLVDYDPKMHCRDAAVSMMAICCLGVGTGAYVHGTGCRLRTRREFSRCTVGKENKKALSTIGYAL